MYLLVLIACAPTPIEFYSETEGCTDWNPSSDTEPYLNIAQKDNMLLVQRQGVEQYCDATFTPVIEQIDSYKIGIREYWDISQSSRDCQTCLAPTVVFTEFPTRQLEFWWYVGDNGISFDVIDTDAIAETPSQEVSQ